MACSTINTFLSSVKVVTHHHWWQFNLRSWWNTCSFSSNALFMVLPMWKRNRSNLRSSSIKSLMAQKSISLPQKSHLLPSPTSASQKTAKAIYPHLLLICACVVFFCVYPLHHSSNNSVFFFFCGAFRFPLDKQAFFWFWRSSFFPLVECVL